MRTLLILLLVLAFPLQSNAQSDPTTQAFINVGLLPSNPPPPYGTDPVWCTAGLTYGLLSFNWSEGWYINNPTVTILVTGNATSPFGTVTWTLISTTLEPTSSGSFSFTTLPYAIRAYWLPYVVPPYTQMTYTAMMWLSDGVGDTWLEAIGSCGGSSWQGTGFGG